MPAARRSSRRASTTTTKDCAVIDEADESGRLKQLLFSASTYLRDGFAQDFAGSPAVEALREAAFSYRDHETRLRQSENEATNDQPHD